MKLDEEKILEMHSLGMTQQKIADELGTSKGGVNNILKKHNKTKEMNLLKINVEEVLKLHSEGYSNPQIAKILNKARSKIYDIIIENNLTPNVNEKRLEHTRLYNPSKDELENDLKTLTIKQIADKENVSSVTVTKRMKELDLKSPRCK